MDSLHPPQHPLEHLDSPQLQLSDPEGLEAPLHLPQDLAPRPQPQEACLDNLLPPRRPLEHLAAPRQLPVAVSLGSRLQHLS